MSDPEFSKRARAAKVQIWLAGLASREDSILNRFLRRTLNRILRLEPDADFMRDEFVDSDTGYEPEDLERYQRGE